MPAPTALLSNAEALADDEETLPEAPSATDLDDNDDVLLDTTTTASLEPSTQQRPPSETLPRSPDPNTTLEGAPRFPPAPVSKSTHVVETRSVPVPPHRMTPLKRSWPEIYPPLVSHLKLQVRMNVKSKTVELRTSPHTTQPSALQTGADFLTAFTLGFSLPDAIALLRLDDLYIETFEIRDVKTLAGEHLSRAIGRIAGKDGKTKFAIENASRTRIVLADAKVHILGGFREIGVAREAVVSLILGSPPGKVYGNLRTVAGRMKERF